MFKNKDSEIVRTKPFRKNMSLKTATRLVKKKWQLVYDEVKKGKAVMEGGGGDTCAFCFLYNGKGLSGDCSDCPIQIKAGGRGCHNTPISDVFESGFNLSEVKRQNDFIQSL